MAVSQARRTELQFRRHFSHIQTPTSSGFQPSECPERTPTGGFWPPGARLATFWGILAPVGALKRVEIGSKMALSEKDSGPFGVPLGEILACFENLSAQKAMYDGTKKGPKEIPKYVLQKNGKQAPLARS